MIIYVNDYDVGIEALPTPTITLLLLLQVLSRYWGFCQKLVEMYTQVVKANQFTGKHIAQTTPKTFIDIFGYTEFQNQ